MSLYLCADCGGSKTAIAIANKEGAIVARAYGGPSNFAYLGLTNFENIIKTTVESAIAACLGLTNLKCAPSLPTTEPLFSAAWLGISGVDTSANVAILTPVLSHLLSIPAGPRLLICNDAHLLAAPVQLHNSVHHAITVIGGTGSISASFKRLDRSNGAPIELARVGGWGWILGDEGGGFHVGREAIRQILMEHDVSALYSNPLQDGEPQSPLPSVSVLRQRVLEHFGVSTPPELLAVIHDADPVSNGALFNSESHQPHKLIPREKRLSKLAPIVFEAAFSFNDKLAISVLNSTSRALASQVSTLLQNEDSGHVELEQYPPQAVRASDSVICFGGSLVGVQAYRDMILRHLANDGHVFPFVEFVADPAATGALGLTLQANTVM